MLKVGLTGGLGCGKTFVSRELQRLGCHIIEADLLGHEVLAAGGPAFAQVIRLFGPAILNPDGQIDRARLAAVVFDNPEKLASLNAVVHPAVRRRESEMLEAIARSEPHAIAVVEAAILIENGSYQDYDKLIVVWCDPSVQLERALARDPHADRATILARLARQMPVLEKRKYADFLIDSTGTKENTMRETQDVFAALVTIEKKP